MLMTIQVRRVIAVLADHPTGLYGREVVAKTGLGTGAIHPILQRLRDHGYAASRWDTTPTGRPVRRYTWLTDAGRTLAAEQAAERDAG